MARILSLEKKAFRFIDESVFERDLIIYLSSSLDEDGEALEGDRQFSTRSSLSLF